MSIVRCVLDAKAILGEGALWDVRDQVLYWVDIKGRAIHRFDPASGKDIHWPTPEDIGSLAVREKGGLVVAMKSGFYDFDLASGAFAAIINPEPHLPLNRFNDGKPDRQGRFWAGSMHDPEAAPSGYLYRLDPDGSCHRMVDGIAIANVLCFSPDGRTLYHGCTLARTIWAWDLDPLSGALANRREFARYDSRGGAPDGATVDAEGHLWVAVWGGWRVDRFAPDGKLERSIEVPAECPTCPAFGGAGLDILYLTTASNHLDPETLPLQPQAGGIFALDVGVKGVAEARFKG